MPTGSAEFGDADRTPGPTDHLVVTIVAAACLAFEILLLRVFSFSQWNHFASLAVSLALLGFGAAGTALALLGRRARAWGDGLFVSAIAGAAVSVFGVCAINHLVRVRPLFAVWDARELGKLLLLDFAAFLPFFAAAIALGQVLVRWPESTRRLYAANLVGSGLGSIGALGLLAGFSLQACLFALGGILLASGALHGLLSARRRLAINGRTAAIPTALCGSACLLLLVVVIGWALSHPLPRLPVSDFQQLSMMLDLPDATVTRRAHSFRAMATEIRSNSIRIAPGLSLRWQEAVAPQDALVLDAERVIPVPHRTPGGVGPPQYLSATLAGAAFSAKPSASAAILGTSAQLGVLLALAHNARHTVWVEPEPFIIEAISRHWEHATATAVRDTPRRYLETAREQFDVILFDQTAADSDSLTEDALLTVQGLTTALCRLTDGGLLAVPMQLTTPPRYFPKLVLMVRMALERAGVTDPTAHVVCVRSMRETLLLVSGAPVQTQTMDSLRAFAQRWEFDVIWPPAGDSAVAGQYSHGDSPMLQQIVKAALCGNAAMPDDASLFTMRPATDSRPWFWYSVSWLKLPDVLHQLGRNGLRYADWGALMLVVTLAMATLFAAAFILAPLGRVPHFDSTRRPRLLLYFAALGTGYMLLEMAAFQRCVMLFDHPVLAAAVVFATFLIGSGVGSLSAPEPSQTRNARWMFPIILASAAAAWVILWCPQGTLWRLPGLWRAVTVVAALLPLAWSLGRPMPWGLRLISRHPGMIAWAWGTNGVASVIAAPLASLMCVQTSLATTLLAGCLCYVVAARASSAGSQARGFVT